MADPKNDLNIESAKTGNDFPIVGIGASAGGLDAIQKLLGNLPENTGLAFIVIQHLAANQESMLPEILSRSTKIPVDKVANGMLVEKDHVYVIPSGMTMTINNRTLKLHPKDSILKPIDEFLKSLAVEEKTKAIGIILSGTGTDGTEGLKYIKAEGGLTFVQDPNTAQYSDMPKNAIAADTAYFVQSPEHMPEELLRIAKHPEIPHQKMRTERLEEQEDNIADMQPIFSLLQVSFGVNFRNYKKSTINRRITRRMVLNRIENIKKYVDYLRSHKEEVQALFDDLLIGVTGFFREQATFDQLKEKVFPDILEKKQTTQPLRVWIPGCSTGEEVYSFAISVEEFLKNKKIARQIQVFGTDLNEKNIERARRGVYLKNIEDNVSEYRLKAFFTSSNGNYQVIKPIRDMCIFAKHDLTRDPPFSNIDLIMCRNVLIYFDTELQERIIPMFHYGLKPNGYLVLGEAESVGTFNYLFESLGKKSTIFRKKIAQPSFEVKLEPSTPYSMRKSVEKPEKAGSLSMLEMEIDKLLISEYVPASLLLNNNLDVLVFRGKVNPYLYINSGVASFNIAKIVKKELRPALQTAVYRAKKDKRVVKETVRFEQGKETITVSIQAKPLEVPQHEEPFFFVVFSKTTSERSPVTAKKNAANVQKESQDAKDQQIKELSEDLDSIKQTLQSIIEQQEATNEELRSANEEVQSSNEELMSTNEELETSKEELQSTNEELTTLNEELKNRNQTLSLLNDDLGNLMVSVDTAVVIVDNDFKIRRFTSQAQDLLRLLPNDVENSILELRLGIPIEKLENSLKRATTNLELTRQEIKTEKGHWYQMRVRPYLTQDRRVGGAILSFSDITEIKKLEGEKQSHTDNLELRVADQAGKLVASERLSAIGATAGMVGHDIRNPLQAISSDAYLIKSDLDGMPEGNAKENIKESVAGIEKNVDYVNKIVADLQDYAKVITPIAKDVNLGELCNDVVARHVPKTVVASCKIEKEVENIVADPDLLKRILSNLVSNAVQAMPEGGELSIHAYKEINDLLITVQDTGVGIPEEIRPKLFIPLFTTKSKGQGFGLAVIKRMTEAIGGTISFESEIGKGTKFILRLPPPKETNGKWTYK